MIGILGSVLEWASLPGDTTRTGFLEAQPGYSENKKPFDSPAKNNLPNAERHFSNHRATATDAMAPMALTESRNPGQALP